MKALDLLGRMEGLEDIDESITLTWNSDSNTGHNQTWIKNVGKKYAKELGKFLREVAVKTSKGEFWILVYEKAAFAGQTVKPGVGHITHASAVELGKKKGRWTLNSDNTLSSSVGAVLYPLPKTVRSARQLVTQLDDSAPDSNIVVSEKDAQASEKDSVTAIKEGLEKFFKNTLPPLSQITYNEKNQMFILKTAMGRQFFGAIWKEINPDVFNVAIQTPDGKSNKLDHVSSPLDVITSRLMNELANPTIREILALDVISKVIESVPGIESKSKVDHVVVTTYIDGKHYDEVGRFRFNRGKLIFSGKSGSRKEQSISLNDLTRKIIEGFIKEVEATTPEFESALSNWTSQDSSISYKMLGYDNAIMYLDGSAVGYAGWDGMYVNFYDGAYEVQSSIKPSQHSISANIEELDNGMMNESVITSIARKLESII